MTKPRGISVSVLAWTALVGNAIVILQGAVVRATGAGAGCGQHWPTCNGEVVPLSHTSASLLEFSHRALTLLVLMVGMWLLIRVWQIRQEKPVLYAVSLMALIFLCSGALLGAATVLFGFKGETISTTRGILVAFHLINSLLLMGSLVLVLIYSRRHAPKPSFAGQELLLIVLGLGLVGMLVLMFSGGIAAMGNTMLPFSSLREGFAYNVSPEAHPLIRLRMLHPLIAMSVGIYLLLSLGLGWWLKPVPELRRLARMLLGVYLLQSLVGLGNLTFLTPAALQLVHLSLAILAFALLTAVCAYAMGPKLHPSIFHMAKEV